MKYTRYSVRKRSSESTFFIIIILMVLVLAYISGSIISKIFFSKTSITISNDTGQKNLSQTAGGNKQGKTMNYIVIQSGIIDNKDNADGIKSQLQPFGNPVIITEDNKYSVILGVYSEDSKAEDVMKLIADKKIDVKKSIYKISVDNLCNTEISGIFNGCLKIIDKLGEKNVHAVQTDEFKKWTSSLTEVDKKSSNISILNDMKKYISDMPKEVSKDNIADINLHIFTIIKKMALP